MRKLSFCFVIISLFTLSSFRVNAQEGWRDIVPLITTKEEVKKKLGEPNKKGVYELDEGRVFIKYVETKCDKIKRCDCLVPQGTVQFIRIEIYYDLFIKDIKLKGFKKTRDSHIPTAFSYSNRKTGVIYEVQNGMVTHINYYESMKTCKDIEQRN